MPDTAGKTGALYVVATPIGNLGDISLRALEILRSVDLIAAEDTRHSTRLLQKYAITTKMVPLHEHNEERQSDVLLKRLLAGEGVALISDAGTPLISDPGYWLLKRALHADVPVVPVPGPCAAITALSVAGLPTRQFYFEGFLPAKSPARRKRLQELSGRPETLVFYESSHRIAGTLSDMVALLGGDREAVVGRELTKRFEQLHRAPLGELVEWLGADGNRGKGEFVVLVGGVAARPDDAEALRVMSILCADLPVKQAVSLAARITGVARNRLYRWGLDMQKQD